MKLAEAKIDRACHLGVEDAAARLEMARGGDFDALADWTAYSVYRKFLKHGLLPAQALQQVRALFHHVDLALRFAP